MADTEEKIKQATTDLLIREGKFGVTINEIAEKCQINRTVINYYFRSKENLLSIVCEEILEKFIVPRFKNLFGDKELKNKIINYVEESEKISILYPYLDVFVISQLNYKDSISPYFNAIKRPLEKLLLEIQQSIDRKEIIHADPVHFLIDLFSLSSYSYIYYQFFNANRNVFPKEVNNHVFKERKMKVLRLLLSQKCPD